MKVFGSLALRIKATFAFPHAFLFIADAEYACPTSRWLETDFWSWFKRQRWQLGLDKWERHNDCDNFARAYAQAASDCYALTPVPADQEKPEGLAVGEMAYHSKAGPHAIVVAMTEGEEFEFREPQTGSKLNLTPEEIKSCFFVRF